MEETRSHLKEKFCEKVSEFIKRRVSGCFIVGISLGFHRSLSEIIVQKQFDKNLKLSSIASLRHLVLWNVPELILVSS